MLQLYGKRYYLSAEEINTSIFGSSLRTRELGPTLSYRLHQIFVSILFVNFNESQQHDQNSWNDRSRAREMITFSYIQRKENRWLLVNDLDREMEILFIDLLVVLYSYLLNDER